MYSTRLHDYMESPLIAATERLRSQEKKFPVEFRKGINGLDTIVLHGPRSSSAEVLLYGAQVISWKSQCGDELLFVSSKADFLPPTPNILGGISVCFPYVRMNGSLDPPGIARNRFWNIDSSPPQFQTTSLSDIFVDLILPTNEADMITWPHRFEYRLRITLGTLGELILTSRIRNVNTNGLPFSFSFAYCNHLRVSNICKVRIEGLETLDSLDKLNNMKNTSQQGAVTVKSEVDKVFTGAPVKIAVVDHKKKQTTVIRKDGLLDVGVWNPWKKKAEDMGEFGENEYEKMVSVEPCLVDGAITLRPGEEWRGQQELIFDSSIYNSKN